MSFRNIRKYKEDGHWEEPAIDADSGEVVTEPADEIAEKQKEERKKIRYNILLLFEALGLPKPDPKQVAWQLRSYELLLARGWSHTQIGEVFVETVNEPLWRAKIAQGEHPGINTVEYLLRNKDPKKYGTTRTSKKTTRPA